MGGVDGYSCSAKAPKECAEFLNYRRQGRPAERVLQGVQRPPVNTDAQKAVTEPYLKQILEAYNKAPYVSQWLDTVFGQNVGNALNVACRRHARRQGHAAGIVQAANEAAAKG